MKSTDGRYDLLFNRTPLQLDGVPAVDTHSQGFQESGFPADDAVLNFLMGGQRDRRSALGHPSRNDSVLG